MSNVRASRLRAVVGGLLAAWTAAIALLTLTGTAPGPPPGDGDGFCLPCGSTGLADMIANWLLFVPFGMSSALLWGFRPAVGASVLATVGIEALQLFVPGRDPALQDIVANALGGLSGAWLALRATSAQAAMSAGVLAVAGWLAPAVLLVPRVPEGTLFGDWTYDWPMLHRYEGELLSATIGGATVGLGELSNAEEVRRDLEAGGPLELRLIVGEQPSGLAPVFSVFGSREREVVLIAVIGDDLVYRGWNPARDIRLDQPDVRWHGALARFVAGDTITVGFERTARAYCMSVDVERRCGLAPGIGDGWALLRNLEGGPKALRAALSVVWSLGLGVVLGLGLEPRSRSLRLTVVVALLGAGLGVATPHVRAAPASLVSFLLGGLVGGLLRPQAALRARALRNRAPAPAPPALDGADA